MSANLNFKGSFLDNKFEAASKGRLHKNINPYNLETLFEWNEDSELVYSAIESSKRAFLKWKNTSIEERIDYFKKLKIAFQNKASELEESIILEVGKARWEAKQEVQALSAKIDITIATMFPIMKFIADQGRSSESELKWVPRGVCTVLGPFNFPLHLPNGHIVPALLAGNTIIFKPSECAPACASLYAECFLEAGFPSGVFQMLVGAGDTGQKLVQSSLLDGVFFTGSYAVGKTITENLLKSRNHLDTLIALEMGGKNASIVHCDAPLEKSAFEILTSAYATAGQRCSATSRVLVHQSRMNEFKKYIKNLVTKLPQGDPALSATFMGPLIHERAVESFFKNLQLAQSEGFRPIVESERIRGDSCLVSPSFYEGDKKLALESQAFKEEFFGPNFLLIPYADESEVFELHEATPYGLVASVFTQDHRFYEACAQNLNIGLLNLNRGTVGASSKLPFGGFKKSGNNWPAGMFSFFYCIRAQSQLKESAEFNPQKLADPLKSLV